MPSPDGDSVLVTVAELQEHSTELRTEIVEEIEQKISAQCKQVTDSISSELSKLSALLLPTGPALTESCSSEPFGTQIPLPETSLSNPLFTGSGATPPVGKAAHPPEVKHTASQTIDTLSREASDDDSDCEANDWFRSHSEFPELRLFAPFIEPGIQPPPDNAPIRPHIYQLIADPTLEAINRKNHKAAASEYKFLVCYGFYLPTSVVALKATIAAGVRPPSAETRLQKLLRAFQGIEEHIRARLAHIRAARSDDAGGSKTLADVFHQIYLQEDSSMIYGSAQFSQFAETFRKQEINSLIHQAAKLTAQKKVGARPAPAEDSDSQKPSGKGAQPDRNRPAADKNKGKDKGKKPLKDPSNP